MADKHQKPEDAVVKPMLDTTSRPHKPTGLTPPKAKKSKKSS
jgi:hypothetical protein